MKFYVGKEPVKFFVDR